MLPAWCWTQHSSLQICLGSRSYSGSSLCIEESPDSGIPFRFVFLRSPPSPVVSYVYPHLFTIFTVFKCTVRWHELTHTAVWLSPPSAPRAFLSAQTEAQRPIKQRLLLGALETLSTFCPKFDCCASPPAWTHAAASPLSGASLGASGWTLPSTARGCGLQPWPGSCDP